MKAFHQRSGKNAVGTKLQFMPVLLGGDANAYGMARSFYEEYGQTSHAICKGAFHICQHSKLISIDITEPNLEDDEVFVHTLRSFANAHPQQTMVLVPCGDNYTKMLVRNQDDLRDYFLFSIMSPNQFDLLSTKDHFYDTCLRFGLAFPQTDEVTLDTWCDYQPPFPYPIIVKPSNSVAYWNCEYPGKKKAFVCDNENELRQILSGVYSSNYHDAMIIQDFIPGDDTRMRVMNCYSDRNGRVTMQCLGNVVLEEHTPLGIGSYGAIMTGYNEDINTRIKGFLEEIGYIGFSNFDLKYDERDGSFKLLEINPRQGRSSYFTTASGKNLARYLIQDILEQRSEPCDVATLDDEVLWTMIPLDVLRRYTSDAETLSHVERLIAAGKIKQSYWSKDDKSLLRWLSFRINQRNYRQQYAQYFNKRHVND